MTATASIETQTYDLVDSMPDVAAERQQRRDHALSLLASRRLNADTSANALPPPADALSTAHKVLHAAHEYGYGSAEHSELRRGLVLDCQRLVAEWYRKKKPEYFRPLRHIFDDETEEFFSHGLSVRQMTENALMAIPGDPEEEARRVNEHVEDATPQILRGLGRIAVGRQAIRTISECTDKAIGDYTDDFQQGRAHRGYGGYVPEIEKLMIRDIRLDPATHDRFEEQVGLPGIYINHEVVQRALTERGVAVGDKDKTELHGSQLLVGDDLMEFVALLDRVAGEKWRINLFMGEVVGAGYIKDYAGFRGEAERRQEGLVELADTVAAFVLELAADDVDRRRAPAMVEDFVKKQLLQIGKRDSAAAEQMFDRETAEGLRQVIELEAMGETERAFMLMQEVERAAPGGGFCGAGSCGLENIDTSSESGQGLAEKVGARPGDTVLKDTERKCKCGKKGIVYAFNARKVNKYCQGCGSFESKKT